MSGGGTAISDGETAVSGGGKVSGGRGMARSLVGGRRADNLGMGSVGGGDSEGGIPGGELGFQFIPGPSRARG